MRDIDDPTWPPEPIEIDLDEEPPTITVAVPAQVPLSVPISISGTAYDDVSVRDVTVRLDGGASTLAQTTSADWGSWSAGVTFPTLGTHTLTVTATDRSGKSTTRDVQVQVVDPTGPVIEAVTPVAGADGRIIVGQRVGTVEFVALDPESPPVVAGVRVGGADLPAAHIGGNRFAVSISMPSTTVPGGGTNIDGDIFARNGEGKESTRPLRLRAADITAPAVDFRPANGTQISGTLDGADTRVEITASDVDPLRLDSGIASVLVGVDGGAPVSATPGDAAGTWAATAHIPPDDVHTIVVGCTDQAGNATTVRHQVTVALATDFRDLRRTAYLADLLQFAGERLLTGPRGHRVPINQLVEVLQQPLQALATADAGTAANSIPALRIVTDALRGLLDSSPPAPYAHWPLDEGSGDRATVQGVAEASGRIVAGTWGRRPTMAGPRRFGAAVPALHFNGTSSYVEIGDTTRLNMRDAVTIAAWVMPTGPGGQPPAAIVLNKEGSYELARFSDGTIRWAFASPAGTWDWTNTSVLLTENEWHHVAVTYHIPRDSPAPGNPVAAEVLTYLDGALRHTAAVPGPIGDAAPTLNKLRIGGRELAGTPQPFHGSIGDVRLYDRALSAWEVSRLAGAALPEEQIWLDDDLPSGAVRQEGGRWNWVTKNPKPSTGQRCHVTTEAAGQSFTLDSDVPGYPVNTGDLLITDVWLDPAGPPTAIEMHFLDDAGVWHSASWGVPDIPDARTLGPLPEPGRWTRLVIPARQVRMERRLLRGITFAVVGGRAAWDRTGRRSWRTREEFSPLPTLAYRALLREVGTSYDELRLARTASAAQRVALAQRLGITLAPSRTDDRPDELDQLLLPMGQVQEGDLSRLFGYGSPADSGLAGPAAEPLFGRWRQARLRELWRQLDAADTERAGEPTPVIDPDLLIPADVDPAASSVVSELRLTRAEWVRTQLGALQSVREGYRTPKAGYDAVVDSVLGAVNLEQLEKDWRAGQTVDALLSKADLTLDAFVRLRQIGALAAAGSVLDEEWDDLYAILTQVLKTRSRTAWYQQEAAAGIRLEPGLFVVARPDTVVELPPWRATWSARLRWQDRLRARRDQLAAVATGLADAVLQAEQQSLPDLRDALVAALAGGADPAAVVTGLTQLLHLEVAASGALLVSPVDQAMQSVQSLMFAARTRTLDAALRGGLNSPARDWVLETRTDYGDGEFDAEWAWMGSYPTWRAAMSVFMGPENLLLPTLHEDLSVEFQVFVKALDDAVPLTPDVVQRAATAFAQQTSGTVVWPGGVNADDRKALLELRPPTDSELTARHAVQRRVMDAFTFGAWSNAPRWMREALLFVPQQAAAALHRSGQFLAALDWHRAVFAVDADPALREVFAGFATDSGTTGPGQNRPAQWLLNSLNPHDIAAARGGTYLRHTLLSVARCLLDFADAEFTLDTAESQPRARALYLSAEELLTDARLDPPPTPVRPPNPLLALLRLRCEINLGKLRSGLNIAGMQRQTDTSPDDGGPVVVEAGAGGLAPPSPAPRPSPYRFAALIARAQQLLASASQVEAAYLASLERRDAERYTLLDARQGLELARARVDLQTTLIDIARDEEQLTELQRQRAVLQWEAYNGWITAGPSANEKAVRASYEQVGRLRTEALSFQMAVSVAQTAIDVLSTGFLSGAAALSAAVSVAAEIRSTEIQTGVLAAETRAQTAALDASWTRRSSDWALARDTADKDAAIARAQAGIAAKRTEVARGEAGIATLQQTHADATVQFLATKFTNADLYAWMSGVLGDVYAYLLQQATVVARLAEQQLAFERQNTPPPTIKPDYWSTVTTLPGAASNPAPDRGGLTGSARLLRDLTTLDQHAFDTNRRKLQLSQSFSLAALAPLEMQQFRQTGILEFRTTMEQFDRSFPGHYLRIIRQVKIGVVGLIPPVQGIRATLTASGVSRVVVGGGGGFTTVTIRRNPETVALTSPVGATGVFELDMQPELLLPFEGSGVDTSWRFAMPRPANPFDLRNIADVVVTIDYTAMHDPNYAEQIVRALPREATGVRAYSLRDDFADSWYDLITAAERNQSLHAVFAAIRSDFPAHVDALSTDALSLYVIGRRAPAPSPAAPPEIALDQLVRGIGTKTELTLGPVSSTDGVISTLTGNGSNWLTATGPNQDPIASWDLQITADPLIRRALVDGSIADLVFAVSYRGQLPPWPS